MINDLKVTDTPNWKYIDDTIIPLSQVQQGVKTVENWSPQKNLLNTDKYKELIFD